MAIEIPFKPYLIRAFYEWTVDNGQTPYIVAKPGAYARVPRQYVKDEHIVLDIGPEATAGLHMDNEGISFKAVGELRMDVEMYELERKDR